MLMVNVNLLYTYLLLVSKKFISCSPREHSLYSLSNYYLVMKYTRVTDLKATPVGHHLPQIYLSCILNYPFYLHYNEWNRHKIKRKWEKYPFWLVVPLLKLDCVPEVCLAVLFEFWLKFRTRDATSDEILRFKRNSYIF